MIRRQPSYTLFPYTTLFRSEVRGLDTLIDSDASFSVYTFETEDNGEYPGRRALRHTASHVLAHAVTRLFPNAKLAIGPSVENGFYYDFEVSKPFSREDLDALEKEMGKIIADNLPLERFELSRDKALELMASQPYKVELINDLPEDAKLSFYRQGDFTDLCAGPHVV